jgi:signal transduction histidine kinase
MLQVEEEERRRISRELHDEAGQSLLLLRLELELAERSAPPELRLRLAEARRVVERTVAEIRRIIAALSPAVLDHLGLPAALRQLAVRLRRVCPARIRLRLCTPEPRLPREVETVAYRLAQECLHNAARHAAARNINLSLRCSDSYVEVAVRDDGVGFDVAAAHAGARGWGLPGMRQRVALLGGTLQLRSHPGDGTTVRARLPLAALRHQAAYADSSHPAHR